MLPKRCRTSPSKHYSDLKLNSRAINSESCFESISMQLNLMPSTNSTLHPLKLPIKGNKHRKIMRFKNIFDQITLTYSKFGWEEVGDSTQIQN